MVLFNHATKEVTAKLVYYGPALAGKTSNLQWIHDHVAFKSKGKMLSLATEADRTLFFDFLPVELGTIRGHRTRVQMYTVPGQVFYDATRRMVLKGADAVVFVADSQEAMLEANLESLDSLRRNLIANDLDPALPMVFQYNKRDLSTSLPLATLNAKINPRNLPHFAATAITGAGVEDTLKGVTRLLFKTLSDYYGSEAAARPAAPSPAAPVPQPPSLPAAAPPAATPRPAPAASAQKAEAHFRAAIAAAGGPAAAPSAPAPSPAAPAPVASAPAPARAAPAAPAPDVRRRRSNDAPGLSPAGLQEDQWAYLVDGQQRGPVVLDDMIDLVLTSLSEDTLVWRPGLREWVPANAVPEIAEQIPPPLPFTGAGEEDFPDFNTVPEALRTALIADEDEGFRKLLALPLAAQGFRIFEAADGAAAWQLATDERPWLMLVDIDMPEVDGFEFCRRVRANILLSHTPLVFVSGSDKFKDRARAQQVGSDDFLSKKTPIRELLIRIQLLLTRYSDLSAQEGAAAAASGLLEGRLEVFGAPGVLQICNQSHLTGIFTARAKDPDSSAEKVAVMGFRDGEIVNASVLDLSGPEAVYAFLAWPQGHFRFVPGDPGGGEPLAQSVEHLLLEGCRLLDESGRTGEDDPAPA